MPLRVILAFACVVAPASAATGVCVANGTEEAYLFVAEARDGVREIATLQPAATLCSPGTGGDGGVVSVFESAEHQEGCSRLVAEGATETLLRYVDFDRCHWSSHDD
ncbi:MAG: hypothetical protein QNJ16_09715 [Rhodobacter sp.]|nr:hypothetical protein [Rhodobacter sp.]